MAAQTWAWQLRPGHGHRAQQALLLYCLGLVVTPAQQHDKYSTSSSINIAGARNGSVSPMRDPILDGESDGNEKRRLLS